MTQTAIQMTPGDELHITVLMAPHGLNFVTGKDRKHLLAFGRAAFEAGQKCQGCAVRQGTHKPAEGLHQIAEPRNRKSMYASKAEMPKAVAEDNAQATWRQCCSPNQGATKMLYTLLIICVALLAVVGLGAYITSKAMEGY